MTRRLCFLPRCPDGDRVLHGRQRALPAPSGPVTLTVRLSHPGQRIFDVNELMPVKPGPLTLYYPKWIPGDHAPDGPIEEMMGLEITAGGQRLAWQRDERGHVRISS